MKDGMKNILDLYRHDTKRPRSRHYIHYRKDGRSNFSTDDFFSQTAALAGLQENGDDQTQRDENVNREYRSVHESSQSYSARTQGAARMISAKLPGSRLAPPTSTPSMSLSAMSVRALSGLTLPPYRILIPSAA